MPKLKNPAPPRDLTLEETLAAVPSTARRGPVWAGPCGAGPQGGVTQSLISRWLCCRERFRLMVIDGLKAAEGLSTRLDYGNLWHTCEEAHAAGRPWDAPLKEHVKRLTAKHPLQQDQVIHLYNVVRATFPAYVDHWAKHVEGRERTPLLQEQEFDVPYQLPSGRVVRLRGKWDSVDLDGKGKAAEVVIQENKSKSEVDDARIMRQLKYDLQVNVYMIAFQAARAHDLGDLPGTLTKELIAALQPAWTAMDRGARLRHVRYNCVKRSTHKSTSADARKHPGGFVGHLGDLIRADCKANTRDNGWFSRFVVELTPSDVAGFRRECLDPILEGMCDDHEWWAACHALGLDERNVFDGKMRSAEFPRHVPRHFVMPMGVYNPLLEAGGTDLDEYLANGSIVGLQHATDLFPELGH